MMTQNLYEQREDVQMEAVLNDLNPDAAAKGTNKIDMGSYKDYVIANSEYL